MSSQHRTYYRSSGFYLYEEKYDIKQKQELNIYTNNIVPIFQIGEINTVSTIKTD